VVHFSGDVTESDGLPRRRAFSLSFGMRNSAPLSHVPRESPLVLKSSSVSSVASRDVEDFEAVIGKLMSSFLVVMSSNGVCIVLGFAYAQQWCY